MAFSLFDSKGTPVARQRFTWRDVVQSPFSKLDDDAFTRVRVILMNGIECEAVRFQHSCARKPALEGDLGTSPRLRARPLQRGVRALQETRTPRPRGGSSPSASR